MFTFDIYFLPPYPKAATFPHLQKGQLRPVVVLSTAIVRKSLRLSIRNSWKLKDIFLPSRYGDKIRLFISNCLSLVVRSWFQGWNNSPRIFPFFPPLLCRDSPHPRIPFSPNEPKTRPVFFSGRAPSPRTRLPFPLLPRAFFFPHANQICPGRLLFLFFQPGRVQSRSLPRSITKLILVPLYHQFLCREIGFSPAGVQSLRKSFTPPSINLHQGH